MVIEPPSNLFELISFLSTDPKSDWGKLSLLSSFILPLTWAIASRERRVYGEAATAGCVGAI
jgi:hypothetical protein